MGKVVAGFLAPHPPHLVYAENPIQNEPRSHGGWETLRWAYAQCRQSIQELKPEVIIVHTPHWQTIVGHHVLAVPRLTGTSVDPIFPHLFRYRYDMQVDTELAHHIVAAARSEGLVSQEMTNPNLRVDYGTIVSLHMLNPQWDIPVLAISANASPYFHESGSADEQMIALGRATRAAIEQCGRRAVVVASNTLSHLHFAEEPNPDLPEDMSKEHIYSQGQYRWDMKIINLMQQAQWQELRANLPAFNEATFAEVKSGGLMWMLAAMNFAPFPGRLYGYGSVIGTGNAVMEWRLPIEVNNG